MFFGDWRLINYSVQITLKIMQRQWCGKDYFREKIMTIIIILCGLINHKTQHSPQCGKRGTAHRGCKYAVKVIVRKACIYQSNRLVFFVIRSGDPPVRTCIPGIRIPAQLHGKQRNDSKITVCREVHRLCPVMKHEYCHRALIQLTSQSRCFFFVISATSSSSKSCKYCNSRLDSQKYRTNE